MHWITLSIISAILFSLQEITRKKALNKHDVYSLIWGGGIFSVAISAVVLLFIDIPPLNATFCWTILLNAVYFASTYFFQLRALKNSEVSQVAPLLSFVPVFSIISSSLILKESIPIQGFIGIALILVGSYLLNLKGLKENPLKPFTSLFKNQSSRDMLLIAIIWSIGAVTDKIGIQHSSPQMWATTSFFLTGIILILVSSIILKIKHQKKFKSHLQNCLKDYKILAIIPLLGFVMFLTQSIAVEQTFIAYVLSIKRLSIVFTVIFGNLIFHETQLKKRLTSSSIMLAGMVLIYLS